MLKPGNIGTPFTRRLEYDVASSLDAWSTRSAVPPAINPMNFTSRLFAIR